MANGKPGFADGSFSEAQLNEPGGLSMSQDGRYLYIADTNNHCIRLADLQEKVIKKVLELVILSLKIDCTLSSAFTILWQSFLFKLTRRHCHYKVNAF